MFNPTIVDFNNYTKAVQLYRIRRYDKALDLLANVLEEDPEFVMVYQLMSLCYTALEDYESAKYIAQRGLDYEADNDDLHFAIAMAYSGEIDYTNAILHIRTAIEIDPEQVRYYNHLAHTYMLRKYVAKAIQTLEIALSIDPSDVDALGMLSQIHYEHIDKVKGKALMDEALSINPESKLLLTFKADQSIRDEEYDTAIDLLEQALADDPSDWSIRELLIDAKLSRNVLYNWFIYKYSGIKYVNYWVIGFDFFLVVFGGLSMREQHQSSDFYPFWFYVVSILVSYRLLVWTLRLLAHLIYATKQWKIGWKEYFSLPNHIMLSGSLSMLSFLIYLHRSKDFFWLATSMCILLFLMIALGSLIIDSSRKKKYFNYYLWMIYSLGMINFLSYFFNWSWAKFFVDSMMFLVFVPLVGFVIVGGIKDSFDSKSKERDKRLQKEIIKGVTSTWVDHLVNWSLLPMFFGFQIIGILYMVNVVQIFKFTLVWGGLGIVISTICFKYLKSKDSKAVRYLVDHETSDESGSRVLRVFVQMALAVVLFGMIVTTFIPIGYTTEHQVQIIKHGYDGTKDRVKITVDFEGRPLIIRPTKELRKATCYGDSIVITKRRSLFGIDYISDFRLLGEK